VPSMAHWSSGMPSRRPWKVHVEASRGDAEDEGPVSTNMRCVRLPCAGSSAAKYTYQRPWRECSSGAQRSPEYGVFGGGRLQKLESVCKEADLKTEGIRRGKSSTKFRNNR